MGLMWSVSYDYDVVSTNDEGDDKILGTPDQINEGKNLRGKGQNDAEWAWNRKKSNSLIITKNE